MTFRAPRHAMETTLRILDVKEREVEEAKPPRIPPSGAAAAGFPQPKTRSRFKQQRAAQPNDPAVIPPNGAKKSRSEPAHVQVARDEPDAQLVDREVIRKESQSLIDSMTPEQILAAQKNLYDSINPNIIQMLLRRGNIDRPNGPSPLDASESKEGAGQWDALAKAAKDGRTNIKSTAEQASVGDTKQGDKKTNEPLPADRSPSPKTVRYHSGLDDDAAPPASSLDLFPITQSPSKCKSGQNAGSLALNTTHFPAGPSVRDLDPSDPDFLEQLHAKFFPNLPADPSKLAWMAPLPTPNSSADRDSPYHPSQQSLPVSQLRFDFSGALLPPRISRSIPVTRGLHHHGEAPEAAGYTIPELARLARSLVPAQRCLAFQTLGRMLYRLGHGEWGVGEGGRQGEEDDMAFALWRVFRETGVLDSLGEAAAVPDGAGHRSVKAYAIEALWLFEKGGWKEKWRGL